MTGDTTFSNPPAISLLPVAGIFGVLLAPQPFSTMSEHCPQYVALVRPYPPHRGHICDPG